MTRTRTRPNKRNPDEKPTTDLSEMEPRAATLIQARAELEAMGIIRWNGKSRRGQKIYVAVPPEELTPSALAAYIRMEQDGEVCGE